MTAVLAFGLPMHMEWVIILLVVLLLFGNRIPGMARALGSGIVEFKKGIRGEDSKDKGDKKTGGSSDDAGA